MKVERIKDSSVVKAPISTIPVGSCFWYMAEVCMVVKSDTTKGKSKVACLNMVTGVLFHLRTKCPVEVIEDVKLVVKVSR